MGLVTVEQSGWTQFRCYWTLLLLRNMEAITSICLPVTMTGTIFGDEEKRQQPKIDRYAKKQ